MLGVADRQTNGLKLNKWSLEVMPSPEATWETVSPSLIISAQLLALIDAQAVRKFVIHPGNEDKTNSAFVVSRPPLNHSIGSKLSLIHLR
jgi:hypothetical protein